MAATPMTMVAMATTAAMGGNSDDCNDQWQWKQQRWQRSGATTTMTMANNGGDDNGSNSDNDGGDGNNGYPMLISCFIRFTIFKASR